MPASIWHINKNEVTIYSFLCLFTIFLHAYSLLLLYIKMCTPPNPLHCDLCNLLLSPHTTTFESKWRSYTFQGKWSRCKHFKQSLHTGIVVSLDHPQANVHHLLRILLEIGHLNNKPIMMGLLHINNLASSSCFSLASLALLDLPADNKPPISDFYLLVGLHPGVALRPNTPPNHPGVDDTLLRALQADLEAPPFPGYPS